MKKILTGLVLEALGGKEAVRKAVREALLEALEEAFQEEPKPKRIRTKAQAEEVEAKAQPQASQSEPEAKPKRIRVKAEADSGEVRVLTKALADLGAAVGPRESELLERRGETLARKALPGKAAQALGGVLEYLRGLTLPEVSRAARLGYYDLAVAAGVGGLVEPPK